MKKLFFALALSALQASAAAAQARVLIVSGLGGESKYVNDFHKWGTTMVDAATTRLGLPRENVIYLAEEPSRDAQRIDGEARVEEIQKAVRNIASAAGPDERVLILLIGHGSADSRGSRINLPGPDLTAEELGKLVDSLGSRPVVVVNTASASGDFHESLEGQNRASITATRSGMERNETVFGGFFVAAFAEEGADIDKNGRVTVGEAFDYATAETKRSYESANQLQMEHSRIEGNLELARSFTIGAPAVASLPADAPPEVRSLVEERQRLEEAVASLRTRSGTMEAAAYQAELERLLLELARTNRAIQEGGTAQ
jgi:hypothetical protein